MPKPTPWMNGRDEFSLPVLHYLDDHTPHFRIMWLRLPPQQRRVLAGLADLNRAALAREIGRHLRMDVHTVSAVLGRLEEKGYVTPENLNKGLKQYRFHSQYNEMALWYRAIQNAKPMRRRMP